MVRRIQKILAGKLVDKFKTKDGEQISIRYPRMEDYLEWRRFMNTLVKEKVMINRNKPLTKEMALDILSRGIKDIELGNRVVLQAWAGKRIVGDVAIVKMKGRMSHVGQMGIAVAKDYRNKGIGTRLSKNALKLAKKDLGIKLVILEVTHTNKPATTLYKKLGFKEFGRLPKAYNYEGKPLDLIYMYKRL